MTRIAHFLHRGACVLAIAAVAAFIGGCAAPSQVPATTQPALAKIGEPFADGLRREGVSSVMVYGNGARIRMATRAGEVFFRYPPGAPPTEFALYVDAQGVEVDSDQFNAGNAAQYEAAMKSILPQAIQRANANNVQQAQQSLGGGRGGR
jgi:hypothetical protein